MQDIPANIEKAAKTASSKLTTARDHIGSVVYGQDDVIELAIAAILSGGHALLVGVPGLAKTLLVETLGTVMGLDDKRVQFTPDLMPGDILGSEVLEETTKGKREFRFIPGPVFTQLLMAALPEAQLDRFLLRIDVDFPTLDTERNILVRTTGKEQAGAKKAITPKQLLDMQALVRKLPVGENVVEAILTLVRNARPAQSLALAGPVLKHRMALNFAARADGQTVESVIETLKDRIR